VPQGLRVQPDTSRSAGRISGQRVGYTRVSSLDQNTDQQLDGVVLDRTFTDNASGRSTARPQLEAMLAFVRDGDTVLVHSMDRLAATSMTWAPWSQLAGPLPRPYAIGPAVGECPWPTCLRGSSR